MKRSFILRSIGLVAGGVSLFLAVGCTEQRSPADDQRMISAGARFMRASMMLPDTQPANEPSIALANLLRQKPSDDPAKWPIGFRLVIFGQSFRVVHVEEEGTFLITEDGEIVGLLSRREAWAEKERFNAMADMAAASGNTHGISKDVSIRAFDDFFVEMFLWSGAEDRLPRRVAREIKAATNDSRRESLRRVAQELLRGHRHLNGHLSTGAECSADIPMTETTEKELRETFEAAP